jgi:tRNA pseudouridine32 synthase / 23S rRNA pseudouridine746 synthase
VSDWAELREACRLLEDGAVLVLSKPAGLSVVGERHDTDLLTMAREAGERLLPVHRIDKVTSGAVLLAKLPRAHADLTRQFNRRSASKRYLAITRSSGLPERGAVELPLSVGRKSRVRVAAPRERIRRDESGRRWFVEPGEVFTHARTYPSLTTFVKVWEGRGHTLLAVEPVTGRRHQIRVHLAWIGHPVAGDPLFPTTSGPAGRKDRSAPPGPAGARAALHSWRIAFDAPWSATPRVEVEAPPADDFWSFLPDHPDATPATLLARARAATA